jgi:MtaA/CmuA family methyltransferase
VTGRQRIEALLCGAPCDTLPLMPITMMFAADQVGEPYRAYASDYRILVRGQLHTAEKFDLDYVSAISDPAREASDLGAQIEWFDHQPPAVVESRALLAEKQRLASLRLPDPAAAPRMSDRLHAVRSLRELAGAEKIVEGWVEGPCAMAADLRGLNTLMIDFTDDPAFVRDLFSFCVEMELRFARAQIGAGADLIGVGDAAASLVGPARYAAFVQPFERALVAGIQAAGARARLHICGSTRKLFPAMAGVGADIVDLDSMAPLEEARAQMGAAQVLLGNVDPVRILRDGTPSMVEDAFARCHRQAGANYIVGAGCEVPRATPDANLFAATRYARSH